MARCAVVEKNAVAGDIDLEELMSDAAAGRLLRASSVSGLALAIAVCAAGVMLHPLICQVTALVEARLVCLPSCKSSIHQPT